MPVRVEFDRHSLLIEGRRKLIRSGSLHYFRLPSQELWRDRLQQFRGAGLNAVDVYYAWNYHSSAPGEYDFGDIRDVERLHDMIEEAGLYLIARPGPYVCAELDMGGLPAWLLREPSIVPRCRSDAGFSYSQEFVSASRDWFDEIVPRFARRSNLLLVQMENEYAIPGPYSGFSGDLPDQLVRWFGGRGARRVARLLRLWGHRGPDRRALSRAGARGQTSRYMRELYELLRERGVDVPISHNDVSALSGRQMDADVIALDRYPVTSFEMDWREDPRSFEMFLGDEEALGAHRDANPQFYAELQSGWYDGWGGPGYEKIRELLGAEVVDSVTKAALSQRATLWNYYMFSGGVNWGYMASPDVYSSYDYAAPIGESGLTGAAYEAVRRLNEFLERYEEELVQTERIQPHSAWCPEHLLSRKGPHRRFEFLCNALPQPNAVPTPEAERSTLAPRETQIRVYDEQGRLEAVSPQLPQPSPIPAPTGRLPSLERWTFGGASPQVDPAYDDSDWDEIPAGQVELGQIDIDALGIHYGCIWYRGTFNGPLDRLLLDARHCFAVWINGSLVAAGDQFRNTLGIGPDGARFTRIAVPPQTLEAGRNTIVVLVESLGHNKGFADDFANPRGIVRIDLGGTPTRWRFRGGLVRGEQGMTPIVAFEGVERTGVQEVVLPHGWTGEPDGVGLYETQFRLQGIDSKGAPLCLAFDPGRGKANLYVNGYLIGRYWPERGPQRRFFLPWGIVDPDGENQLAITVWKRAERAALGRVRLELM